MSSLITDQQPTRLVLAVIVAKDREVGAERWQLVFLAVAVEVDASTGHHVAGLVRQGVAPQHGVASGRRGGRGNTVASADLTSSTHASTAASILTRADAMARQDVADGSGSWHADARRKEAFLSEPGRRGVVVALLSEKRRQWPGGGTVRSSMTVG
jgi:hypothetical protein